MYYSNNYNNYKLEYECISNLRKFKLLHNFSMICKIFALLSLIALIWKLWFIAIAFFLFILSFILSNIANSMIFSYEYWLDNGELKITKHLRNNTSILLLSMPLESDYVCDIIPYNEIDFENKRCYIDKGAKSEIYIKITMSDFCYYILADKYFYSLLMEKK